MKTIISGNACALFIKIGDHSFEVFGADLNCHHSFLNAFKFKGDVAVVARFFYGGEDLIDGNVAVTENGGALKASTPCAVEAPSGVVGHTALEKGVLCVDEADVGKELGNCRGAILVRTAKVSDVAEQAVVFVVDLIHQFFYSVAVLHDPAVILGADLDSAPFGIIGKAANIGRNDVNDLLGRF